MPVPYLHAFVLTVLVLAGFDPTIGDPSVHKRPIQDPASWTVKKFTYVHATTPARLEEARMAAQTAA